MRSKRQAIVEYTFTTDGSEQAGRDKSNINEINASNTKLTVKKEADSDYVVLGDEIEYTITIKNETQSVATNIVLKDELPRYLKLVDGYFKVNGMVVTMLILTRGLISAMFNQTKLSLSLTRQML